MEMRMKRPIAITAPTQPKTSFADDLNHLLNFLYGTPTRARNTLLVASLVFAYGLLLDSVRHASLTATCGF